VFANLWLTRPLVIRNLEGSPATNAMVRTTTATTVFQAGSKDNVLPSRARAVVNFRILPGDSIDSVLDHVRRVIDDRRVGINRTGRFFAEPSAVSSSESETFRALERTIRSVVPDAVVAPFLVVVVTDARYYAPLSRNVFRFLPVRLTPAPLARMHGTNGRLAVRNYETAVRLYRQLLVDGAGQ
jgi:carboxypeptidase PM20D1